MSFKGKVVLITGASSGIGENCAETFAQHGAFLSIVGRNKERLSNVSSKCEEISLIKPLDIVADITKDAKKIIDETIQRYGRLDVLVNNAGILAQQHEPLVPSSLDIYDETMNTNVRATYELTMYAIPHLIKTKGNIVNISSTCGIRQFTDRLSYCISKSALDQFTKCLALELAPNGVRVNSINPTTVITNFHLNAGYSEEECAAHRHKAAVFHPLERVAEAQDVSNAILYIAGDGASFVTGALLPVCGGASIKFPR